MKNKFKLFMISLCSIALQVSLLSACSNPDKGSGTTAAKPDASIAPNAVNATVEKKEDVDINKNDTGKTVIKTISRDKTYPNNSYMLISKSGTVVVADPYETINGIKPDLITSTHNHPDHNDANFSLKHNCKKSYYKVESFSIKDVNVTSIAASHMGNTIDKSDPNNVLYVYEVDGLRIAHMGDIGQDQLTDEQLKALGKIDIAFMQFVNSYSDYSVENGKGFKLIEQLKPQVIIPTHSNENATKKIGEIVGAYESAENVLVISKDDLSNGKRKVVALKNTLK